MTWQKLLSRYNIDIPTISEIDLVYHQLLTEFRKHEEEGFFTHLKEKTLTHYYNANLYEWGKYVYIKYFNNPKKIKDCYKQGKELLKQIKSRTNHWSQITQEKELSSMHQEAYAEFQEQFKEIIFTYSIGSWLALESWQHEMEKFLTKAIKKNNLSNSEEAIYVSIYQPWRKTALQEIEEKIGQGKSKALLAQEYQFMRSMAVVWHTPIDAAFFNNTTPSKEKRTHYSLRHVIKLLNPSKDEEQLILMSPYMAFFKDWRDDVRRKHAYAWLFLFENIASCIGVNTADIGYLTLSEIETILREKRVDKTMIEQRKHGSVIILPKNNRDGKITISVLEPIPEKYKKIMEQAEREHSNKEVRGITANGGKVIGNAVIVNTHHDTKKVREGDIIVANTTHPEYLPAMQKASAFVTNEGGILCHAAIVARETDKPCIVGAENATKIIKDGDKIEVDADKGTVRIITHN